MTDITDRPNQSPMTGPIAVKKAYKDGHIGVSVTLKASGWGSERVKIEVSVNSSAPTHVRCA